MKKSIGIVLCVLLSIASLWAGGAKETASAKKSYVFAADATWPPLEFVDDAGNLTGFEVELMPAIGKEVGVEMTVKNIPWDTIFAGLANGAYDGVSSGVTVTEERKATMDFSSPILSNGQVVIIKASDKDTVRGIGDLTGKKIGVQIGTTGDFSLEKYKVEAKRYDDIGLAIEDMLNGNVSACVCDSLIASDFVLSNANYKGKLLIAGEPFTQEDIAIAVKKGDAALLKLVNDGLAAMEKDGTLAALKKKWNIL
jgi:polar amino acid transport system substrate-binding protein